MSYTMNENSDCDSEKNIEPRDYQIRLMEWALQKNTIIYLPTGSGKTFIALMVLRQMAAPLNKPLNEGRKISFMLVNTVALVDQQSKYIRRFTHFKVGAYSGEMNVDLWDKNKWQEEFQKHQVFVMTAQIFANLLTFSFLTLSDVNLLIFDECHHGVNDHVMRQVMKYFGNVIDEHPRILGLTATLLNKNCKPHQVIEEVKKLETTFNSQIATADELKHVIGYSTNPTEKICLFQKHVLNSIEVTVISRLKGLIRILKNLTLVSVVVIPPKEHLELLDQKKGLKDVINLINDTIIHIEMLGTFGGKLAVIAHTIQLERIKKHCQDLKLSIILDGVITTFVVVKKLFENELKKYDEQQILKCSSNQVLVLRNILKEYQAKSSESLCGIIFVQRRFTAKIIYNILLQLKATDDEFDYLKPNFLVGFNIKPFNDTREGLYNAKINKKILMLFQNKEVNLLVASNVLEEGVDIPTCTLVIKFDKPVDYRSYIQSKGRARHKRSYYYMMVEKEESDNFKKSYCNYQAVENLLNNYLIGQNEIREGPSQEQVQEMLEEDLLPPYRVNGAQVNMVTAISLLARYCSTLYSDKYTVYSPNWFVEIVNENIEPKMFKVVIELPIICPIREPIEGCYMKTKKDAKRAAALKACEILHKQNELDDHLLPKRRDTVAEDVSSFFAHWPNKKEFNSGSSKKRSVHTIETCNFITGCLQSKRVLYLHVIHLAPNFTPRDMNQRMLYDLYCSNLCFGVLSTLPLPEICNFSVFISMGEFNVNFLVNKKTVMLDDAQVKLVRQFHVLIFKDLLNVLKRFLIFDNSTDGEGLFVVPIVPNERSWEIDFNVMIANTELKPSKQEPNDQERLEFEVSDKNYLSKIITPWYRSEDVNYLVIKVCHELNALSKFPSDDYDSFKSYFKDKYRVTVLNPTNSLLLVKALSKRLTNLKQRTQTSKKSREKMYEDMEEHLIPELCVKQDFPAALWVQAYLLPSILYRIITLLQAEELRQAIAKESGLGCVKLPSDEKWLPLVVDESTLNANEEISINEDKNEEDSETVLEVIPQDNIQNLTQSFSTIQLESEYPWPEKDEPVDIERRLDVTLMDIHYYENFLLQQVLQEDRTIKNDVINKIFPCITFNKDFVPHNIQLLKQIVNEKGPELKDIYSALTAAKCNDVVNLERLETLGDSFLKLSISLFITLRFPEYDEGKASTLKGKIISNKNLYHSGLKKKLSNYLNLSEFLPNLEWKPPGFCLPHHLKVKVEEAKLPSSSLFKFVLSKEEQISGVLQEITENLISSCEEQMEDSEQETDYDSMLTFLSLRTVPDKTVADSIEALIGAYFSSCGFTGALKLLEWLQIIPVSESIVNLLNMTPPNPIQATNITNSGIDYHIPSWEVVEKILDYHFHNRAYLLQSLTHSSYSCNRITHCYQTLEFLGDAVIDFLITCHIFETCEKLNPGELTDLRSALVNNVTFAGFAVRCGLHKFLLFSNNKLMEYINNFVIFQEARNFVIDDEVLIMLEETDIYLSEHIDVPKVLGDVFEALIGAVFLDSSMNLELVWNILYRIMWKEIEQFKHNVPKNAIRLLYETPGAHPSFQKPKEIETGGIMIKLDFMVNGEREQIYGFGENKNLAKKAAAKIALRLLKKSKKQ